MSPRSSGSEWEKLERHVESLFPGTKRTKGSGRIWGDGDVDGSGISFEAKDQKRVNLDSWWSQTRRQAMKYGKEPVLVMVRPPAKLEHGSAVSEETLAVCNLSYLAELHEKIRGLEGELADLDKLNPMAREAE